MTVKSLARRICRLRRPRLLRCVLLLCCLSTLFSTFLLWRSSKPANRQESAESLSINSTDAKDYDVFTEGCKISRKNAFDESIRHLIWTGETHITCEGHQRRSFHLHPLEGRISLDKRENLTQGLKYCEAETVVREDDDGYFFWSEKKRFSPDETLQVDGHATRIRCFNSESNEIQFTDFIPMPVRDPDVAKKKEEQAEAHARASRPLERPNVLLFGLDGISRLNFLRQLPQTRRFLMEKLESIEFFGFNKVAENTIVNLVPVLTGKFIEDIMEVPKPNWTARLKIEPFDDFPFVWKNFSDRGYWTLYSEDTYWLSTFNYFKKGFAKQPTDHYYRPFSLALADSGWENTDEKCYGNMTKADWLFEWLVNGLRVHKNDRFFAVSWCNVFSHDYLNDAGNADGPTLELLEKLHREGILDNTVLFFFSDHGIRWGPIRETLIGRYEARMPFFHVVLPRKWKTAYPDVVKNLKINSRRFVTNFDIYETLLDLLDFGSERPPDRSSNPAVLPSGRFRYSLLSEIPGNRTCDSARVSPHWCVCLKRESVSVDDPIVRDAADFVVDQINEDLSPFTSICQNLTVGRITNAVASGAEDQFLRDPLTDDAVDFDVVFGPRVVDTRSYLVTFHATPGHALFEATVRVNEGRSDSKKLEGTVSRLNTFGDTSWCVENLNAKLYCYCREQMEGRGK